MASPSALDNARALYDEGINQGEHVRAIHAYTGDRYIQHSHPVPDGREGFISFFEAFLRAHPQRDIEIIRSFQDGQYVFLHALQVLDGGDTRWVTMDIFDSDHDGKLIEHWDIIQAWAHTTASGHTMTDGPVDVGDTHDTEADKNLVRRFLARLTAGDRTGAAGFLATQVRQHAPSVEDGPQAFVDAMGSRQVHDVVLLIGSGQMVTTLSHADVDGVDSAVMDLFLVEDGLIAEHWECVEAITPPEEWANSGKF